MNDGKTRNFEYSNLSGIDLSQSEISAETYYHCFSSSYMSNTGLHIKLDKNTFGAAKQLIGVRMKQGTLDNCYINKKRIKSKEELLALKESKKLEYEEMKTNFKKYLTKELKKFHQKLKDI